MISMTFGEMPDFDEFEEAFDREVGDGRYEIRAGQLAPEWFPDGDYTAIELYRLINKMKDNWGDDDDDDSPAQVASDIMGTLGFEWV